MLSLKCENNDLYKRVADKSDILSGNNSTVGIKVVL